MSRLSFARENARLRIREIEERRGFPEALRTLGGLGGHFAALADVPASSARENARLRIREIEERHGFPGALRTLGVWGPYRGPHVEGNGLSRAVVSWGDAIHESPQEVRKNDKANDSRNCRPRSARHHDDGLQHTRRRGPGRGCGRRGWRRHGLRRRQGCVDRNGRGRRGGRDLRCDQEVGNGAAAGAPAPAPSGFEFLAASAARFLGGLDLVGEESRVQRAGRLVFLDVLTLGLVALHEVPLDAAESPRPFETDHHGLRHHGTPELTCTASAHVLGFSFLADSASHHTLSSRSRQCACGRTGSGVAMIWVTPWTKLQIYCGARFSRSIVGEEWLWLARRWSAPPSSAAPACSPSP